MPPPLSIKSRHRQFKIFSWTGAFLLIGILIAVNFMASYVPLRLDMSQDRMYSISRGSKEILKKLDDTLLVRVIFSSELPPNFKLNEQYIQDLLVEFKRAAHGKIRVENLNPNDSPKAKEEAMNSGVVPVRLDIRKRDRREVQECFMGISLFYGDRRESVPFIQDTQGLEYEISQRIKKLVDPTKISIGIVKNGEALNLRSENLQALENPLNQLYTVEEVDLKEPLPTNLKALWILGPSKEFEPEAVNNLKTYIYQGGTVGLLLDSREVKVNEFRTMPQQTGLEPVLDEAGVKMKEGLIVDPQCDRIQIRAVQGVFQMINLIDYPYFPLITNMDRKHPATKGLDGFSMPFVSALEIANKKSGLTYSPLAMSSPTSWLDTFPFSVSPMENRTIAPDSIKGPFNVILLVEGKFDSTNKEAKPGRLILFGSSRFIRSDFPPRENNYALFLNMLDWSAQDEVLLSIRSKGLVYRPIKQMADATRLVIKYAMILSLPFLSLVTGIFVWRREKLRRTLLPLVYREA